MSVHNPHERAADRSPIRAVASNVYLDIVVKCIMLLVVPYVIWNVNTNTDTQKNTALNGAAIIALSGRVDEAFSFRDTRLARLENNDDKLSDKIDAMNAKLQEIIARGTH